MQQQLFSSLARQTITTHHKEAWYTVIIINLTPH